MESLASQSSIAEKIGQDAHTMPWLVSRIQQKESPVSQNKQYAAEILAIILQSSPKNREKFASSDGVDTLLQLLSSYRKRDPEKDSDEEEYVENLFDCLTCVVDEEEGKAKFLEAEGLELAQIMLREGKLSKQRALRVLDHALSGPTGIAACEHLVEIAGLRTIFGMFMKKVSILFFLLGLAILTTAAARNRGYRAFIRHLCLTSTTFTWRIRATNTYSCQVHGERLRENRQATVSPKRLLL